MALPADYWLQECPASVARVLQNFELQRIRLAEARIRGQASGGETKVLEDKEGLGGEVKMRVDKTSYHYWGQRLGYRCWEDATFVREYLRDNPYARVRSRSRKIQTGYRAPAGIVGVREVTTAKRFRKSYGG